MLNPNQGPLPVPTQANVTFDGDCFSDTSKDSYSGDYSTLYDSFNVNPNNAANVTTPNIIRDSVAAAGAAYNPLALVYISDNKVHVLVCPLRIDCPLGASNLSIYGKTYAFNGDLYRNQGLNVEIPNNLFNLVSNQYLVPTVAHTLLLPLYKMALWIALDHTLLTTLIQNWCGYAKSYHCHLRILPSF